MSTDVNQFISELDGGVFEEKLSAAISDVAGAVIDNNKKGKVTIELEFVALSPSQVQIVHILKSERPTLRGDVRERNKTATPMYVGTRGKVSFFPENQGTFFDKRGNEAKEDERFPNRTE